MSWLDQKKVKKEPKFAMPGWGGSVDSSTIDELSESVQDAEDMADEIDDALDFEDPQEWSGCRCW